VDSLISYLHYLSFMVLFAALAMQHLLFNVRLSPAKITRLVRLNGVYGTAAMIVLATGLLNVFALGKPSGFYLHNGFFHAKITLFLLAVGLSVWPSKRFYRAAQQVQQATAAAIELPATIAVYQRAQLLALVLLPLLAVLMVRGG